MKWLWVLAAFVLLALYVRSPIDFIPDRVGLLGLLDDVLGLVFTLWWVRRQLGQTGPYQARRPRGDGAGRAASDTAAGADDPYSVLGIPHGASPDEITRAYREQMKRYHPDRVAGLGEELQRVAHEKTVAIQRAYEALGKR